MVSGFGSEERLGLLRRWEFFLFLYEKCRIGDRTGVAVSFSIVRLLQLRSCSLDRNLMDSLDLGLLAYFVLWLCR